MYFYTYAVWDPPFVASTHLPCRPRDPFFRFRFMPGSGGAGSPWTPRSAFCCAGPASPAWITRVAHCAASTPKKCVSSSPIPRRHTATPHPSDCCCSTRPLLAGPRFQPLLSVCFCLPLQVIVASRASLKADGTHPSGGGGRPSSSLAPSQQLSPRRNPLADLHSTRAI